MLSRFIKASRSVPVSAAMASVLAFAPYDIAAAASVSQTGASDELRLETIGYRIASNNSDRCERPDMLTGLMLHDIGAYAARYRTAVAKAQDLTYGFGVRMVVPGSIGERTGIQPHDEIIAVNGLDLQNFAKDSIGEGASYDRTERFVDMLQDALRQGPATLTLRRNGMPVDVRLAGQAGCGGRMALIQARDLNAWADGRYVAVTTRMMNYTRDDDELAFVVAHEMSHNILHHAELIKGASGLFTELGFGAVKVKQTEIAADGYAIGLLANAGYALDAPERFLRRSSRGQWMNLATTHPGASRRIAIVNAALSDLASKAPVRLASIDVLPFNFHPVKSSSMADAVLRPGASGLIDVGVPRSFDWSFTADLRQLALARPAPSIATADIPIRHFVTADEIAWPAPSSFGASRYPKIASTGTTVAQCDSGQAIAMAQPYNRADNAAALIATLL